MSNSRVLHVTFSDGIWEVPVSVIAKDREQYYRDLHLISKNEKNDVDLPENKDLLAENFENEDDYEIIDWASNNMDWTSVEDYATEVQSIKADHNQEWANAEKYCIEKQKSQKFEIHIETIDSYKEEENLCIKCVNNDTCKHKHTDAVNDPKYEKAGLKAYISVCSFFEKENNNDK
jgi:hypothetical protein